MEYVPAEYIPDYPRSASKPSVSADIGLLPYLLLGVGLASSWTLGCMIGSIPLGACALLISAALVRNKSKTPFNRDDVYDQVINR